MVSKQEALNVSQPVKVALATYDGKYANFLVTLTSPEYETREGNTFFVSYKTPDASPLADDATVELVISIGSNTVALFGTATGGGEGQLDLYEGVDFDADGTELTPVTKNRASTKSTDVTVSRDPTVNSTDTLLESLEVPGGQRVNAVGSVARTFTPWLVKANEDYLLRFTNRAGNAQHASIAIEWFQRENGD